METHLLSFDKERSRFGNLSLNLEFSSLFISEGLMYSITDVWKKKKTFFLENSGIHNQRHPCTSISTNTVLFTDKAI